MNDKDLDKLISVSFENGTNVPKGLSERLESKIDQYIEHRHSETGGKKYFGYIGIVASILLCAGLFFMKFFNTSDKLVKDTFKNPVEAEICAGQTLALISENLNKGLSSFDKAKKNIDNTNKILNNTLKIK
jgi:hypothetical protein